MISTPVLVNSYKKFCAYREQHVKTGIIDLAQEAWLYPMTLLPLGNYLRENGGSASYKPPASRAVARYFSKVVGESGERGESDFCCPMIELPHDQDKRSSVLQELYKLQNGDECGGTNAFKYVVGELVDNIYQHSEFTNAFVMAQRYPTKRFVEMCFFDNGISIPGSFERDGLSFKDHDAIVEAINGLSTKKDRQRGHGLGSCIRIIAEGLGGEACIISRQGALYLNGRGGVLQEPRPYQLEDAHVLQGTLIGVRVPFSAEVLDIYNYVEPKPEAGQVA